MVVCFVPKCKSVSNQNNSLHFFLAPKQMGKRWEEILWKVRSDRRFNAQNKNDRVCSLHFEEKCLIKEERFLINGNYQFLPRKNWTLSKDAIPTLFPDLPLSVIPNILKPRKQPLKRTMIETKNSSLKRPRLLEKPDEDPSPPLPPTFNLDCWYKSNQQNIPGWRLDLSNENFNSLYLLNYDRGYPVIEKSFTILCGKTISSCKLVIEGEDFTEKLLSKFNLGLEVSNLPAILHQFQLHNICKGIPGFKTEAEVTYRGATAYSKECLEVGTFTVCQPCKQLYAKLYNKLHHPVTKLTEQKRKLAKIRVQKWYSNTKRKLTKTQDNLRKVKAQMIEVKRSLKEFEMEGVSDKVKALNLPAPMESGILHSLKLAKIKSTKGMRYSSLWLLECLVLKIKSSAAYRHIRNSRLLPLPHPCTLGRLISSERSAFGFNNLALQSIYEQMKTLGRRDRQGILMFDEIQLRETVEFNSLTHKWDGHVDFGDFTDELVKTGKKNDLANHAFVIMYRPLNSNWVQPIAAFATRNAAPGNAIYKLILEAIIRLESVQAEVLAVVCDGAKPNKSFWKQCGIGLFNSEIINKMENPVDSSRNIYFCGDVPHIFKCIRNHFKKYGEVNYFGEDIDFNYYESLLIEDSKRLFGKRKCPKLTKSHINPNAFEKMNVPLATQLFSGSVATGLQFYREMGLIEFEKSEWTEKFTMEMNKIFDILNARIPSKGIRLNDSKFMALEGFEAKLKKHSDLLSSDSIFDIPFASPETYVTLWITVRSTIEIIQYLSKEFEYGYVLTGKINQDCLERFFGIIRASGGGEDHPTVTNFCQLFRLLSLYNPVKRIIKGNVSTESDMEVLVNFEAHLKQNREISRQQKEQFKEDLEEVLVEKLLLCEKGQGEIGNVFAGANSNILDRNIVYYLAGYLCYKAKKILKCNNCIVKLSVIEPEVNHLEATLTQIVDYGSLHHPSKAFFMLILSLEEAFCDVLATEFKCGDIIIECAKRLAIKCDGDVSCGASGHFDNILVCLFPVYITMRLHFYSRCKRNELGHGKATKKKRKMSKLDSR